MQVQFTHPSFIHPLAPCSLTHFRPLNSSSYSLRYPCYPYYLCHEQVENIEEHQKLAREDVPLKTTNPDGSLHVRAQYKLLDEGEDGAHC